MTVATNLGSCKSCGKLEIGVSDTPTYGFPYKKTHCPIFSHVRVRSCTYPYPNRCVLTQLEASRCFEFKNGMML